MTFSLYLPAIVSAISETDTPFHVFVRLTLRIAPSSGTEVAFNTQLASGPEMVTSSRQNFPQGNFFSAPSFFQFSVTILAFKRPPLSGNHSATPLREPSVHSTPLKATPTSRVSLSASAFSMNDMLSTCRLKIKGDALLPFLGPW